MSDEEFRDLEDMLALRGLQKAPSYTDEPQENRAGPRGGGGRKHRKGMKPPPAKKARTASSSAGPNPAKKARRADTGRASVDADSDHLHEAQALQSHDSDLDEPEAMDVVGGDGFGERHAPRRHGCQRCI